MTHIEEFFNREMELASDMKRIDRRAYWVGYSAGLMRALFGTDAVADRHHESWLRMDSMGEEARGYRDGYHKLANCPTGTTSSRGSRHPEVSNGTSGPLAFASESRARNSFAVYGGAPTTEAHRASIAPQADPPGVD